MVLSDYYSSCMDIYCTKMTYLWGGKHSHLKTMISYLSVFKQTFSSTMVILQFFLGNT